MGDKYQFSDRGIKTVPLDTEVWYRMECSRVGEDDWNVYGAACFDSMIAAKSALDCAILQRRGIGNIRMDDYEFRIVKVTTQTEVVEYSTES